jgi:lysyl-tRNA synthetase class 2
VEKNWRLARRKNALRRRAQVLQEIRKFFIDLDYLEVETPHRIPAPAPESYVDAVVSGQWFLHTSPELCMKRMLAAGHDKIFQVCRCWREGERGSQHIPEFTLLEWYRSECNYLGLMEECEDLVHTVAAGIGLGKKVVYRNQEIELANSWERISVQEAFQRYSAISMAEALDRGLFDEIMVQDIEPKLGVGKPTFIYDYPAERRAMARLKQDDRTLAERFELYIGGLEIANAFSELIDAEEQRSHFLQENAKRQASGKPAYPMPEKFLEELGNMRPSAGIALGVDRLVMVFLNAATIDEVVAFTPEEL